MDGPIRWKPTTDISSDMFGCLHYTDYSRVKRNEMRSDLSWGGTMWKPRCPPITRDVAGRTIVHHLLASHPVIVSGPVGLGQGVGPVKNSSMLCWDSVCQVRLVLFIDNITVIAVHLPIECSIGWKKFLPRRVGVAEDTPIQAVSGLALSALPGKCRSIK